MEDKMNMIWIWYSEDGFLDCKLKGPCQWKGINGYRLETESVISYRQIFHMSGSVTPPVLLAFLEVTDIDRVLLIDVCVYDPAFTISPRFIVIVEWGKPIHRIVAAPGFRLDVHRCVRGLTCGRR